MPRRLKRGADVIGTGIPVLPDEDDLLLAGEYVPGSLPRDEAGTVEMECSHHPVPSNVVTYWESRFALRLVGIPSRSIPPELRLRIDADRLPGGPAEILVSLESAGGSPTGPVLHGRRLQPLG